MTNPAALPTSGTVIFVPGTAGSGPVSDFLKMTELNQWAFTNGLGGLFNQLQYQPHLEAKYPGDIAPIFGTLSIQDSINEGVVALDKLLKSTPGMKIVVGVSQGTMVIDQELRNLVSDPHAPPVNECFFLNAASPERPGGLVNAFGVGKTVPIIDYVVKGIPNSQYNVTVLTQEYDGFADWPQNGLDLVADLNALLGIGYLHGLLYAFGVTPMGYKSYPNVNTTLPLNVTKCPRGGVITTYLLPTPLLPLLDQGQLLSGLPWLDPWMRPSVDLAYNRAALNFTEFA